MFTLFISNFIGRSSYSLLLECLFTRGESPKTHSARKRNKGFPPYCTVARNN